MTLNEKSTELAAQGAPEFIHGEECAAHGQFMHKV